MRKINIKRKFNQDLKSDAIEKLNIEIVKHKKHIQRLEEQLKQCDEAVFEAIVKSTLYPLGKITDHVMRRMKEYSDSIGEKEIEKILPAKTHKRKSNV